MSRQMSEPADHPLRKDVEEPLLLQHGCHAGLLGHLKEGVFHLVVPGDPFATNPTGQGVVPEIFCHGLTPTHTILEFLTEIRGGGVTTEICSRIEPEHFTSPLCI